MRDIILIAHNLRSSHNVGSLLRTAEGLGVRHVFLTGYTPYPHATPDERLPHIATKVNKQIQKTALGAETLVSWSHEEDVLKVINRLHKDHITVAAVEQAPDATPLSDYNPPPKIALLVGREVEGLEPAVLKSSDLTLEITMFGQKESFNVAQAAAMALFYCRFAS